MRRRARRFAKNIDFGSLTQSVAPEFAEKFGLPIEAVNRSIVPLLKGKLSPEKASKILFSEIAHPQNFVDLYFEKLEVDRTALPGWMRKFGEEFEKQFYELRLQLGEFPKDDSFETHFKEATQHWPVQFGQSLLKMASDDVQEFGLDGNIISEIEKISDALNDIPSARIVGLIVVEYVGQILGLHGNPARIERSFGGDLIHSFYISHVDLWRGDRRFSEVVRRCASEYSDRVVSRLSDLPGRIENWTKIER